MKHPSLFFIIFLDLESTFLWCKKSYSRDFPGGPVVKTLPSNAVGAGSIPGRGAKIPHASGPKKTKQKTETIL